MIKGQVCGIKTMMDGDIRLTINIPQERVPDDMITWSFEDVFIACPGKGDVIGNTDDRTRD
jgi:hypothetical protein